MGFPILGDPIYGNAPRQGGPALHLHSREITVPISKNKPAIVTAAPAPKHMHEMLAKCGWMAAAEPVADSPKAES
jgi:tRNA pseudouridine32 synthase/23S rRNA pseudouridine746 synthase